MATRPLNRFKIGNLNRLRPREIGTKKVKTSFTEHIDWVA